jgi:hypothetical protein
MLLLEIAPSLPTPAFQPFHPAGDGRQSKLPINDS